MWWQDLLWGVWNGITGWVVVIAHVFGWLEGQPLYDDLRRGTWYDLGFIFGAASPIFWPFASKRNSRR